MERNIKYRRVIICGKAGSGKDYLRDAVRERGVLSCNVSATTRPPRANEVDGEAYHFYTNEVFDYLKTQKGFYEHGAFNGWQYGTLLTSWQTSQIFIMTPAGIRSMTPADRAESYVLYLDISEDVRRQRLSQRVGDADSVERRLAADERDFAEFTDYDYSITNPVFDAELDARTIEILITDGEDA